MSTPPDLRPDPHTASGPSWPIVLLGPEITPQDSGPLPLLAPGPDREKAVTLLVQLWPDSLKAASTLLTVNVSFPPDI